MWGLASGVCYAAVVLALRRLRAQDATWLAALNHLVTAIFLAPFAAASGYFPTGSQWALLAAFGVLAIFLSRRYAWHTHVPVLLRASFERTGIDAPIWVVRWEKWVKLSPIEKAFESINFGLRQLDQAVPVHVTPIERAAKLTGLLPDQADQIKILLDEHQTSLYTSRSADVIQARRAASNLRKQVIIERIRSLFFGKSLR